MIRLAASLLVASVTFINAAPVAAAGRDTSATDSTITTAVVTAPPVVQPLRAAEQEFRNGRTLNIMFGSYGALQGLDMYSTDLARRNGAYEANPLMNAGSTRATAMKAATSALTYFTVRSIAKKNKKAAVVTMAILNGVTGAVVVNNLRNARR